MGARPSLPNAQRYVRRYVTPEKNLLTGEVIHPGYDCIMEIWWNTREDTATPCAPPGNMNPRWVQKIRFPGASRHLRTEGLREGTPGRPRAPSFPCVPASGHARRHSRRSEAAWKIMRVATFTHLSRCASLRNEILKTLTTSRTIEYILSVSQQFSALSGSN